MPEEISRDIRDCCQKLQDAWLMLKTRYETTFADRELILTCTYRPVSVQRELYAQGRTKPGSIVTYVDGILRKSKHNYKPSKAFDLAIKVKGTGKVIWDPTEYGVLGIIAKRDCGIKWGGDFKMKDYPHFEV